MPLEAENDLRDLRVEAVSHFHVLLALILCVSLTEQTLLKERRGKS